MMHQKWFKRYGGQETVVTPASPPWQPVTENLCTPWIELRETKRLDHPCEIVLFQNTFAASFCRATPWTSVMRELPLALPLRPWGIAHSLAEKRHQLRSARVRRHTVFDSLAPLAEHSADVLVPPRPQIPAQCSFFRSHLLVICAAKPRYTAAAAREHRRVFAPRLPTPPASVTSPLHAPREVLFEMCQRRVLLARIKGEVRQVQFCKWLTTIQGSLEPFCRLTHSIIQARRIADERLCGPGAWSAPVAGPCRAARTRR